MRNTNFGTRCKSKFLVIIAFFVTPIMTGCQQNSQSANATESVNIIEDTVIESKPCYHSDTQPEDCFLCGEANRTLLPFYRGQKNLGVINLNTLDLVPITINLYDDSGKLIEKPENGFLFAVTANIDRGYANGDLFLTRMKC